MTNIKQALLEKIISGLNEKIEEVKQAIQSAKESRDSETKSSVGDKYETSRTLMQMEVEKNRVQLNKTEFLKAELLKIKLRKTFKIIEFGSLAITSQNNYFISSAIGKIEVENENYYCISLASPIGKQLHTKKVGDSFSFQGKEIQINKII